MRFAHVVERGVELAGPARLVGPAEPGAGRFGQLDVHVRVRRVHRCRLGPRREPVAAELAQRLELRVPRARARRAR